MLVTPTVGSWGQAAHQGPVWKGQQGTESEAMAKSLRATGCFSRGSQLHSQAAHNHV